MLKIIDADVTVQELIDANNGYCPCAIYQNADTKCPCKEFREQTEPGECHCGRYEKVVSLIDDDALIAEYDRVHVGAPGGARKLIEEATTIDAVPVVRCRYCSPHGFIGVRWDFEDIGSSMTFLRGKLTIHNEDGDEAEAVIRHCPMCGAKLDGEAD